MLCQPCQPGPAHSAIRSSWRVDAASVMESRIQNWGCLPAVGAGLEGSVVAHREEASGRSLGTSGPLHMCGGVR